MATTDSELRQEVRDFGKYSSQDIDQQALETAISRAKRHLVNEVNLDNPNWYDDPDIEDALFWTTMLFSKIIVGDLDAKKFTVGGIKEAELLAKSGNDVTIWYRNYQRSRDKIGVSRYSHTTSTSRTETGGSRNYSN